MRNFLRLGVAFALVLASPALAANGSHPKHPAHYNGGLRANSGGHATHGNAKRDGSYRATSTNHPRNTNIAAPKNTDPYKAKAGIKPPDGQEQAYRF